MTGNNRRKVFLLMLAIILTVAALPLTAMASSTDEATAFKSEVLRLTNIEREKAGLAPLQAIEELNELAQIRSDEIKIKFSHTRPNNEKWFTVFQNSSLKYKKAGENLAFGFRKPADLVKAWMRSDSHKANILSPEFEHLGIGFSKDARGKIHISQMFFQPMPVPTEELTASK